MRCRLCGLLAEFALLDAVDAENLKQCKQDGDDQGQTAESAAFAAIAEHRNHLHCKHSDQRIADAGAGSADNGKLLTVFCFPGHCRNHGPERDVHHRVGHAPEHIDDCKIRAQTAAG